MSARIALSRISAKVLWPSSVGLMPSVQIFAAVKLSLLLTTNEPSRTIFMSGSCFLFWL